mmetsp:Transcript_19197/g.52994  ORF Transcript_19197/g.52994 Transcript_19197/m.52994 type:complete len:735 (-) Transcript_19197:41-2245(-)
MAADAQASKRTGNMSCRELYREEFNTFRPTIKVIDCTIRDGGLMNKWQFSDELVRDLYKANIAAGVDYMEIGYFTSESYFKRGDVGSWRFCADEDLRRIMGKNESNLKISAMCDIGRIDDHDIPQKSDSLIDLIRVACYDYQIDEAIRLANLCVDRGYEVSVNLMAVAKSSLETIDACLDKIGETCRCHYFYIADSFGSVYGEQVRLLAKRYIRKLGPKSGVKYPKIIGYHGHNNQQLGFANSVEGIIEGLEFVDGSVLGMGRGSGNTCLEQILCFLHNPKYDPRPIFEVIEKHFIALRKTTEWGVSIPYLIQGARNEHPKDAMAWEAEGKSLDCLGFYDKFMASSEPEKEVEAGGDPDDVGAGAARGPRVPNHCCELYRKEFFTYRPEIRVIDTTVRYGGFRENWKFSDDFIKGIYKYCIDAGIDYMEVGYLTGAAAARDACITPEFFGPWRFCKDADLRRVFGENKTALKLAAMCDVGFLAPEELPEKASSLLHLIRVAGCCHQAEAIAQLVDAASAKGFEVGVVIHDISIERMESIESCLARLAASKANIVTIDDTRGALYNEQVELLTKLFVERLPGKTVGFSGANNLQMSFANSVVAVVEGANLLDGSVMGLGRGCGGCPMENLMCFLKNPKFKLRPVLVALQEHVQPLHIADPTYFGLGPTGCPSLPFLVAGTRNDDTADSVAWCNAGMKNEGAKFLDFVRSKSRQFPTPKARLFDEENKRVANKHVV